MSTAVSIKLVPTDPDEERRLAALAYVRGPSALLEEGYSGDAIAEFMRRPQVADAFAAMAAEHKNEDILFGRVRFLAKREMARHVPDAVDVMRRALRGPTYSRDENGAIRRDARGQPLVTDMVDDKQMVAATDILNRLGVGGKNAEAVPDNNPNTLFTSQAEARRALVQQGENLTAEQRTLGRERLRAVMEALAPNLAKIRATVLESVPAAQPDAKPVKATVRKPAPKAKPRAKR
jgi:hypothetical protein